MWGQTGGYQLTQLYACRNLDTYPWFGWLMGGLNYHAVHHAFPDIPFNRLPEAFDHLQAVLQRHDLPLMPQGKGYVQETIELNWHPATIGAVNPQDIRPVFLTNSETINAKSLLGQRFEQCNCIPKRMTVRCCIKD